MQLLFPYLSRDSRKRTTGWQALCSRLLLAAFLLVGTLLVVLTPSTARASAAPVSTTPIQLSELTMINPQNGWAFNADQTHLYVTHNGPEHWVDVTPSLLTSTTNNIITASFFPDATHGYLGVLQNYQTAFLLSTQNGGQTWQTTPFNIPVITDPVSIHQITFINPQHGWIAFNRGQFQPGQFYLLLMSTSDGGKTWQTLLDTSQNPSSLPIPYSQSSNFSFVNPQDGWVTGILPAETTYFYSTRDGGKTWSPVNITPIKGADSIYFTQGYGPFWQNSQNGTLFIKYDTSAGNGMPHLTAYQTHDGGKTWILGPSSPSTSFQEFITTSFINFREGWSFGFDGQGQYIIHTTSTAGLSWPVIHPTGLIQPDANNQVIADLTFINAGTGWVIIKDAQNNFNLFQTNNGGQSWHVLHPVVG